MLLAMMDGQAARSPIPRAVLSWQYSPGFFLPTDNRDAKTCYAAGARDGSGNLYTTGQRVYLPFTTAGGSPTIGQTVWMAAARDDVTLSHPEIPDASRGKATATLPDTSIPDKITGFPYGCQQVVVAGICRGGEDVLGSRYFLVELAATPFAPIPNVTPSDPAPMTFKGLTCYGGSYNVGPYIETDGTTPQTQLLDGEWFEITWTQDNVRTTDLVAGHYAGFASYGGTGFQGWEFAATTLGVAGQLSTTSGGTSTAFHLLNPGINKATIANVGGKLLWAQNGVGNLGGSTDIDSTGINGYAGAKLRFYWSIGSLTGIVKMTGGAPSRDTLITRSRPTPLNYTNNPWAPDPALIVQSGCQWYLDLTSYAGGAVNSVGGPAGTGFAWTKVGSPVSFKSWTINWHRSPASLLHWAPGATYDQNHHVAVPEMATFRGTCPNMEDFANIALAVAIEDQDNADESGCSIIANGAAVFNLTAPDPAGVGEQFVQHWINPSDSGWFSRIATDGGSHTVDFLTGDMLWRQGVFQSGVKISAIGIPSTVTLEAETTTRVLVMFGDGTGLGGHSSFVLGSSSSAGISASPGAGAVPYMRLTYPGKIIADTPAVGCMYLANQFGNGSMVPWARRMFDKRTTGGATTAEYGIATGYNDWIYGANSYNQPRDVTIAQWAALIDELHALDPSARIMIWPPPQTNIYTEVDVFGATLQSYVTAIQGLTSGRPWLRLLDVTGPSTVTYNGLIHPGAATPINLANVLLLASNVNYAIAHAP